MTRKDFISALIDLLVISPTARKPVCSLICHFTPMSGSIENHLEKIKVLASAIKSQKNFWLCVYISCYWTVQNRIMWINKGNFHIYWLWGGVVIWYPTFLTVWTWKHEWISPAAQSNTANSLICKKTKNNCEFFFNSMQLQASPAHRFI